eukprot:4045317-Pleurochrysis_carterae.AAC.2
MAPPLPLTSLSSASRSATSSSALPSRPVSHASLPSHTHSSTPARAAAAPIAAPKATPSRLPRSWPSAVCKSCLCRTCSCEMLPYGLARPASLHEGTALPTHPAPPPPQRTAPAHSPHTGTKARTGCAKPFATTGAASSNERPSRAVSATDAR